jgi:hypothetical protein
VGEREVKKPVDLERLKALAGGLPVNPIGSCFDAAAFQFVHTIREVKAGNPNAPRDAVMVHGIGVANMPGQEGELMGHAWLELNHPKTGQKLAMDCLWHEFVPRDQYHRDLKVRFCVKYKFDEFMQLWLEHDNPGPWNEKIRAITDRA